MINKTASPNNQKRKKKKKRKQEKKNPVSLKPPLLSHPLFSPLSPPALLASLLNFLIGFVQSNATLQLVCPLVGPSVNPSIRFYSWYFLRFLASLFPPKFSSDLKYGPCTLARDWGSRVSGLVHSFQSAPYSDLPLATSFTQFALLFIHLRISYYAWRNHWITATRRHTSIQSVDTCYYSDHGHAVVSHRPLSILIALKDNYMLNAIHYAQRRRRTTM